MSDPVDIPEDAQDQLRKAVNAAIAKPQQAQGFLSSIPDLSAVGGYKDKVAAAITAILGALDTIQQYAWLIPDKYEGPLQKFEDALRKVQGWLA
jgi:hypothetical protein